MTTLTNTHKENICTSTSVAAVTQALIVGNTLFTRKAELPGNSVYEILAVNGFFITLFIVAALLFRKAVQEHEISVNKHAIL